MEGPRALRATELDELMELVNGVFRAGGGRMRECFPTLFCEENLDNVRIIKEEGRIVSHLGVCVRDVISEGVRFTVGNVGAVCTHEEYRKRGYAEALLRDSNAKLRAGGLDMLFVSGDRSLYRRHGCARVGKVSQFTMTRAEADRRARRGVHVELAEVKDIDDLAHIHQRDPVRFHRPIDDWRALTSEGNPAQFLRHERRFYKVTGESDERAYIILHVGNAAHATSTSVTEYSGARGALVGALGKLAQQFGEISVPIPAWDRVLHALLHGLAKNVISAGGTVCILNLPQLVEKIRPLIVERIPRADADALKLEETVDGWRVSLANDELRFPNDEAGEGWMSIARLIFGTHDDSHMKDWPDNGLTRALRAAFPIARPEYGLSYI